MMRTAHIWKYGADADCPALRTRKIEQAKGPPARARVRQDQPALAVITTAGFSALSGEPDDPIRTVTSTVSAPVKAGQARWAIAVPPNGTTVCVASWSSGTVTPIWAPPAPPASPSRSGRARSPSRYAMTPKRHAPAGRRS